MTVLSIKAEDISAEDFKDFLEGYKKIFSKDPLRLIVDYGELYDWNAGIAEGLLNDPDVYLLEFEKATLNFSKEKIEILIKNIPTKILLRDLRSEYIGKLVSLNGIICRVIPIRPMIKVAAFQCRKCGDIKRLLQDEPFIYKPDRCGIGRKGCRGKQFRLLEDPKESKYIDVQDLAIQQKPEDLKAGQAPQLVNLEITRNSLINIARAGDIVNVVGILRTKPPTATTKKRKWELFVDVVYIESLNKDPSEIAISPEEEEYIRYIASDPKIYDMIMGSIAPSIWGCRHIKEAVAYQLFGGCEKKYSDRTVRGNIHVLWIDDPSTAKSQVLVAAKNIAPRGLYVSGGGASGAGLTAAVVKVEGEIFALEAGAVVLANEGICCIDEIEKMNDDDRARIHEAMAQQTVNIQKATAHYTLPAKTAILAAGNPTFGRYDSYKTVGENISLPSTILSRFDLIFVGKGDQPDEKRDDAIASHLLEEPDKFEVVINKKLLRKYIALAKRLVPRMTKDAKSHIKEFYKKMRTLYMSNGQDSPIVITARQLEGLIRISEAHARIRLSESVDKQDVLAATNLMMISLKQVGIDPVTGEHDIDRIMGFSKTKRDKMSSITNILADGDEYSENDILEEMERRGTSRDDTRKLLYELYRRGDVLKPRSGFYKKT